MAPLDQVILVVAAPGDLGARAAARAAASLPGRRRVHVVGARELRSAGWRHEVSRSGRARTRLRLPGCPDLHDADVATVLFRDPLQPAGSRLAHDADQAYAAAELTALVVSWLAGLGGRVVNAVHGGSPYGPAWSPEQWLHAAAEAGLPVGSGTGGRDVLLAGPTTVGARDDAQAAGLRRLAGLAGCRLLELTTDDRGDVVRVSPVPALRDPAHVWATARMLTDLDGADRGLAA